MQLPPIDPDQPLSDDVRGWLYANGGKMWRAMLNETATLNTQLRTVRDERDEARRRVASLQETVAGQG